jgi:tetratricopeptide (TPR) repeat protein
MQQRFWIASLRSQRRGIEGKLKIWICSVAQDAYEWLCWVSAALQPSLRLMPASDFCYLNSDPPRKNQTRRLNLVESCVRWSCLPALFAMIARHAGNSRSINLTRMITMSIHLQRYSVLLFSALLFASYAARADEIQDANNLFRQGLYTPALEKVETVLKAKPKDSKARFLKGLILTEQGKNDEAIAMFSAMTEDFPDMPEPFNNLAVLYAGQGKYDKAREALETAIRNHPNYPMAHENLGDIYAKMASKEYERAQQLDPNNPAPQTKLGIVQQLFPRNPPVRKPAAAPAAPALKPVPPAAAPPAATPAKP